MESILNPWPWYVAGPMIGLVMFLLLFFGKTFGISSNLRTICAAAGGGKFAEFFCFDWKDQTWNLVFVLGTILGGFISMKYLSHDTSIQLGENTIASLTELGFTEVGSDYIPARLFGAEALGSLSGLLILIIGGFLVGFGARYAGGCTSGHAISGLSNLQLPSLIAVIGFFIGGLTMVYLIYPLIF